MTDILRRITENWFLTEPLLFAVFCTHTLKKNNKLSIPFRTGKKTIEYSEEVLSQLQSNQIEEYFKVEILRILLKHPYQRQPPFPKRNILTYASNITIADSEPLSVNLPGVNIWPLQTGLCFEEYYAQVFAILANQPQNLPPNNQSIGNCVSKSSDDEEEDDDDEILKQVQNDKTDSSGDGNSSVELVETTENADVTSTSSANIGTGTSTSLSEQNDEQASQLWEEDIDTECEINELIEVAIASNQWGTIGGKLQGIIQASLHIDMDYRKMLSIFKTSVISHKRILTRMKPSRRFGFIQMGSRYELATNLLIAVDVSGSVTDKSLSHFFSVINRLFKYGVEKLDVIQFDAELKSDTPIPLKKAKKTIKIQGRGGTSFQPAADYYCCHPEYDGLIYFTDGYAPKPTFQTKRPIDVLWVLTGKQEYEAHREWIKSIKRNRVTYIPRIE